MRVSQITKSFDAITPLRSPQLLGYAAMTATGIVLVCCFTPASADDTARVLPKGVSAFTAAYLHYKDITERFGASGKKESRAVDYNADLNSSVFPALAPLDPLVGGTATIGNSVVDSTLEYRVLGIGYSYGITDKLRSFRSMETHIALEPTDLLTRNSRPNSEHSLRVTTPSCLRTLTMIKT